MADETVAKAFPLIGWEDKDPRPAWLPRDWRENYWPVSLTLEAVDEWLRLTDESLITLADWEQGTWSQEQQEHIATAGTHVVSDVGNLVSLLRRNGLSIAVELPTGETFSQIRARQLVRDVRDALAGTKPPFANLSSSDLTLNLAEYDTGLLPPDVRALYQHAQICASRLFCLGKDLEPRPHQTFDPPREEQIKHLLKTLEDSLRTGKALAQRLACELIFTRRNHPFKFPRSGKATAHQAVFDLATKAVVIGNRSGLTPDLTLTLAEYEDFSAELTWEAAALRDNRLKNDPPSPPSDPTLSAGLKQYVTLDQMAARVSRSKRTLERYKSRMPAPAVEGGGGKPAEWLWSDVRPWLESTFDRVLPERLPWPRPVD